MLLSGSSAISKTASSVILCRKEIIETLKTHYNKFVINPSKSTSQQTMACHNRMTLSQLDSPINYNYSYNKLTDAVRESNRDWLGRSKHPVTQAKMVRLILATSETADTAILKECDTDKVQCFFPNIVTSALESLGYKELLDKYKRLIEEHEEKTQKDLTTSQPVSYADALHHLGTFAQIPPQPPTLTESLQTAFTRVKQLIF